MGIRIVKVNLALIKNQENLEYVCMTVLYLYFYNYVTWCNSKKNHCLVQGCKSSLISYWIHIKQLISQVSFKRSKTLNFLDCILLISDWKWLDASSNERNHNCLHWGLKWHVSIFYNYIRTNNNHQTSGSLISSRMWKWSWCMILDELLEKNLMVIISSTIVSAMFLCCNAKFCHDSIVLKQSPRMENSGLLEATRKNILKYFPLTLLVNHSPYYLK